MGLRCLLGHDFGEPETERQRNEEGNEVVVTVREVKTCQTCGETRVVSENKEIKSIEQLRRSAVDDAEDATYGGTGRGGSSPPAGGDGSDRSSSPTAGDAESDVAPQTDAASQAGADAASQAESDATSGPVQSGSDADGLGDVIQNAEQGDDATDAPAGGDDAGTERGGDGTVTADDRDPTGPSTDRRDAPIFSGAQTPDDLEETVDDGVEGSFDDGVERDDGDDEDVDPGAEDAVILNDEDDAPDDSERKQWEETASPEEIPGKDEPEPEPEGDDAVIMGAEDADPTPETTEDGYTPWPTQHAEDEGHNAGVPDDETPDVDFGGGLAPATPDEDADDNADTAGEANEVDETTAAVDDVADVSDVGRTSTDAARNGADEQARRPTPDSNLDLERSASEANLEYHCADCGLTRAVGNSSMRAGDICPECRRGYIVERPKQR